VIAKHFSSAIFLAVVGAYATPTAAAPKKTAPRPRIDCFDVTVSHNSQPTTALFAQRHCQAGGVTWAPIVRVLVQRRGPIAPVVEPTPGWTGGVYTLNGVTRFAIDDEAEAAHFCTTDRALLTSLRGDYQRLNADVAQLRRAMAEASALEMECFEADGSPPRLPKLDPLPALPPAVLAAAQARTERLRLTIERQPAWCFPPHALDDHKGLIQLLPEGRAVLSAPDGKLLERGSWHLPRPDSGDDRIEVVLQGAGLFHFNLGPSGRLGIDYIAKKGTLREDLIPGDRCPHAPGGSPAK